MQYITVMLILLLSGNVVGKCPVNVLVQLPLVVEYALWRGWHQALIYTPDIEPGIVQIDLIQLLVQGNNDVLIIFPLYKQPNQT